MNFLRLCMPYILLAPLWAFAQTPEVKPVLEIELRSCLLAEQEGLKRFNQLENRAAELKGTEKLLAERRTVLQEKQRNMAGRTNRQNDVEEMNNMVSVFNQQTDQLNADKLLFEREVDSNNNWMNTNVKPKCEPIRNRPIEELTVFYACGFNSSMALVEVPYCKNMVEVDALKACVAKAGSRPKAQEQCGTNRK